MSQPLTPIKTSERIPVIDALRGFAVLGILLMNVKASSIPGACEGLFVQQFHWIIDKITYWGLEFMVQGKFFTMFTFLFGLGMAIQMSRAIAKGSEKKFPMVYVRRLLLLLVIGFIHDVFIWYGLVLLWYPVMGFPLLIFRKFKPRLMLTLAIFFILLTGGISTMRYAHSRPASPPDRVQQTAQTQGAAKTVEQKARERCNTEINIYKEGGYAGIVKNRLGRVPSTLMRNLYIGWYVLGMFMLGVWTWRKGVFSDIEKHRKFIKKTFLYSLIIGAVFTAVTLQPRIWGGIADPPVWKHFAITAVHWLGYVAFTICYISGFLLLYRKASFKRLVKPIEAVGRAALSNYIFQNMMAGFIFYSYGLKQIGDTGPLVNLLICFLIFAVQIPLSVWWMKRFRFGPIEWLWRTLTYPRGRGNLHAD